MTSLILYTTAALMACVGFVCAVLCVAWSVPSLRRRLARPLVASQDPVLPETGGLTGWYGRIGSILVSTGIAACAFMGWYGCYCVLAALSVGSR